MDYSSMRADILELFREAQRPLVDRIWQARAAYQAESDERRRQAEREEYHTHKALFRHKDNWQPGRAAVGVSQCPLCGGVLEHREGFAPGRAPIHVGICSK